MRTLPFFIFRRGFDSLVAFKAKHIILLMGGKCIQRAGKPCGVFFIMGSGIYWFEICGTISERLEKFVEMSILSRVFFTSVET